MTVVMVFMIAAMLVSTAVATLVKIFVVIVLRIGIDLEAGLPKDGTPSAAQG